MYDRIGLQPLSGTITVAGTSKVLAPASPRRRGILIQNASSDDLWLSFSGPASGASPCLKLPPDALYESPDSLHPQMAIAVWGAGAGQAFTAWEW